MTGAAVGAGVVGALTDLPGRLAQGMADPGGPLLVALLAVAAVLLARRPRSRLRSRAVVQDRRGRRDTAAALRRPPAGARPGRGFGPLARTHAALRGALPGRARLDPGEVGALVGEAAALLRAGALPADAWAAAAARRPRVAAAMARGRDPAVAQATAGARAAVRLAADLGAPPADVLDRTVGALVESAAARTARDAALAGPRASARLLGVLPAAGLGLGFAMGADPLGVLLGGGLGTACLVAGVTLYAVGARWVGREVARASRGDEP